MNADYKGVYTHEEIERNRMLYDACTRDTLDPDEIRRLILQGADPLGPIEDGNDMDLSEHVYERLLIDEEWHHLPAVTRLFLEMGMDVSKPRIPYDGNSVHPLWSLSYVVGERATEALKILLDHGLDAEDAYEFWGHSIGDLIYVDRFDPNDAEHRDYCVWTMKMVMLIASYERAVNEPLRKFLQIDRNSYDLRKFREWNDFDYTFDTSKCKNFSQFGGCVITVYEKKTGNAVWRIEV